MSFLTRPRSSLLRFSHASLRPASFSLPRATTQIRFATQDYGSGQGDPVGEKPQQQGQNPSENIEHPGPPPPKVARGQSSSSPDSSSSPSSSSSSSSSSKPSGGQQQSQSNDGATTQGSNSNSNSSQEVKGAQPKILNENPPSKDNEPEDVKQHNRDMENRTERAHEQVSNEDAEKDKVSKGFWAGQGGRDRDP